MSGLPIVGKTADKPAFYANSYYLSNLYKREPFRHHSYLSDLAVGLISGLGADGYEAALRYAVRH